MQVATGVRAVKLRSKENMSGTLLATDPVELAIQIVATFAFFALGKLLQSRWSEADESEDTNTDSDSDAGSAIIDEHRFSRKDWMYLFFWSCTAGGSRKGEWTWVGKLAFFTQVAYALCRMYLLLTLHDRLPPPCRIWTPMYWIGPHVPLKDPDWWGFLVAGPTVFVLVRSVLLGVILKQVTGLSTHMGAMIEDIRRIQKDKVCSFLASRACLDRSLVVAHYLLDIWAFLAILSLIAFFKLSTLSPIIATGNPLYFINLLANAFAFFWVTIWSGLMFNYAFITVLYIAAYADIIAFELSIIPDFQKVNPHQHCLELAKQIRHLHQTFRAPIGVTWEIIMAETIAYILDQVGEQVWIAWYLSPLLDGEDVKGSEDWTLFSAAIKRMLFFCFLGICTILGLPVFLNKRCDKMCQRINDLMLHFTCGFKPQVAESPETQTDEPRDLPFLIDDHAEASITLFHTQSFTDHVNFKSGLGMSILGIRITPDIAKVFVTIGLICVAKFAVTLEVMMEEENRM